MPFLETCRMEERVGMLLEYASGNWSVTELVPPLRCQPRHVL